MECCVCSVALDVHYLLRNRAIWKKQAIMNHQQIVINNLAEKLNLFTSAVNGELVDEADFMLANTGIPKDTFNILLPKAAHIKNTATS